MKKKKKTTEIPDGLGDVFTHMGWQMITNKRSDQYKLKEEYGENFDEEGFGYIEDDKDTYYAIACTTTFGDVGDKLIVELESGDEFNAVIADIKSQNNKDCNEYGHQNGHCVVEFVVDKNSGDWKGYGGHKVPSRVWTWLRNNRVTKITNIDHFDF